MKTKTKKIKIKKSKVTNKQRRKQERQQHIIAPVYTKMVVTGLAHEQKSRDYSVEHP